jgi:hypothetical protein
MKKVLVIAALALFIGGISAPAIAANSTIQTQITLNEDDPKTKKKSDKKAKSSEKKSDCSSTKAKSSCCDSKKSSDCSKKSENKK